MLGRNAQYSCRCDQKTLRFKDEGVVDSYRQLLFVWLSSPRSHSPLYEVSSIYSKPEKVLCWLLPCWIYPHRTSLLDDNHYEITIYIGHPIIPYMTSARR